MNCPKCNSSNVKAVNLAARTISTTCAAVAGAVVALITRSNAGGDVYRNLRENMCSREEWNCRDCGHAFTMPRSI